jgi:hypothetical protein
LAGRIAAAARVRARVFFDRRQSRGKRGGPGQIMSAPIANPHESSWAG